MLLVINDQTKYVHHKNQNLKASQVQKAIKIYKPKPIKAVSKSITQNSD